MILLSWVSPFSCFSQLVFQTLTLFYQSPNAPRPCPLCMCPGPHFSRKASLPAIDCPIVPLHLQSCALWHQSFPPALPSEENRDRSSFSWAFPLQWTPSVPSGQETKIALLEPSSPILSPWGELILIPPQLLLQRWTCDKFGATQNTSPRPATVNG